MLPALQLGARLDAARSWVLLLLREDRRVVLLVGLFALAQLGAALWDLPCMWGWENDGAAPIDLFGGLALNLKPGSGHRYPLFHYLLLAVPCLPVVLLAVATAPRLGFAALGEVMMSVPVLTAIALFAKLLCIAMGALTLLALARIARRLFGTSAGLWTACFAATNLSLSYYTRSTNLDLPYLMWGVLAADRLLDVLEHGRRTDYVGLAVLMRYQADADAGAFFANARADRLPGYALAFEARPHLPRWAAWLGLAPVAIHGSTAQRLWILVRAGAVPQTFARATRAVLDDARAP